MIEVAYLDEFQLSLSLVDLPLLAPDVHWMVVEKVDTFKKALLIFDG